MLHSGSPFFQPGDPRNQFQILNQEANRNSKLVGKNDSRERDRG
jgi:hypothetical protein